MTFENTSAIINNFSRYLIGLFCLQTKVSILSGHKNDRWLTMSTLEWLLNKSTDWIRFQILRLLLCGNTKTLACPMLQPLKMPLGKVFIATKFDEVESCMALVAVPAVAVSAWWAPRLYSYWQRPGANQKGGQWLFVVKTRFVFNAVSCKVRYLVEFIT